MIVAGVIGLVLLAYLLSVGPFYWLMVHHMPPEPLLRALLVIYAPVDWLADNSESFESALAWYLELWVPKLFSQADPV